MSLIKPLRALGVTSSSSADSVGLSLILTDGVDVYDFIAHSKIPYEDSLRDKIIFLNNCTSDDDIDEDFYKSVNEEATAFYVEIIKDFINSYGDVDVIGLERNVINYDVKTHIINQIGNPKDIASAVNVKVVSGFHKSDIFAGGQGFPLTPTYYSAITTNLEKPVAVVEIGGVSSITWIGSHGEMMSFDAGPGNLAINDWTQKHAGMHMDYNGKLAITGRVDDKILNSLMRHKYLALYPPKSVDAKIFDEKLQHLEGLSLENGAATVTAFVAEAIAYSMLMFLPEFPSNVILCGGGAKNPTLVRFIRQRLNNIEIKTVSDIDLNIDAMDDGAAAFLAVRRLNLLPISFPNTTGVAEPVVGGDIYEP